MSARKNYRTKQARRNAFPELPLFLVVSPAEDADTGAYWDTATEDASSASETPLILAG